MFQVSPRRVSPFTLVFSALILANFCLPVAAQLVEPLTTQDLADKADQIVVGSCNERNVKVKGGMIVTEYKIKVSEFWKGQRTLDANNEFTMTEIGGVLENARVPVAQYTPGCSDILPGEDVLLFLNDRQPATSGGKKMTSAKPSTKPAAIPADSPTVTGLWQGRFSVITNPQTGARMIAHTNISPVPGAPLNLEMRQKLLAAQGVKTTRTATGAKASAAGRVSVLPEAKVRTLASQLDEAAKHYREQHAEAVSKSSKVADEIYQFEPIDSVKSRVMRLVKHKKQ